MEEKDLEGFDFTESAWESLYDAVDDIRFHDYDAELIYDSLRKRLKFIPFGDYLKRYIYVKAGLSGHYHEIDIKEYQKIIKVSFADNSTPPSFEPTTAKLSALSKNWLTQQTVKRKVVFLLGFGLNMSVDDVNIFLTKALREPEINPKEPFEVICWYCLKNGYGYPKFERLWELYEDTLPNTFDISQLYRDGTIGVRNTMCALHDDATLLAHLSRLKATQKRSKISVTADNCFKRLYDEARLIVANLNNDIESEKHHVKVQAYQEKLSRDKRLYDYEKQNRVTQFESAVKVFTKEDITESDLEHIICSAIPTDRHGNLTPSKASKLNEQFAGRRFSRQRISEILSGNMEINRFDLITLNFFIFSQRLDQYPNPKTRYSEFVDSTNKILQTCYMGQLYIQNPYECFVLMCILSDDPLGTYADVWELSYDISF